MTDDILTAERIARAVAGAGGRVYYVGGFVRDRLMGRENKDIDIEVHGVSYETLKDILEGFGGLRVAGASFGVFGLKGCSLDIAMPRREKATGRGHKDFSVYVDPFIGPEKAAQRRDFTVNAMMQDVLTGEVLDYYGGRRDLENRLLRRVNEESFAEDPLRVLRAAQFAARFGFKVDQDTVKLCRGMDLSELSRERVAGELDKALEKAENPSVFFEVLREMNQLSLWFPETEALIGVPQNPRFHPEGDVWNHTMKTLDSAARLRERANNPRALMYAALCHDFGKPQVSAEVNGVIHAYRHEITGEEPAGRFVSRLTAETALKRYVCNMERLHMRPNQMVDQGSSDRAYMHVFDESVCPEDLLLLCRADFFGSSGTDYGKKETVLQQKLCQYRELMEQPCVQGADLIAAGLEPGPQLGEALEYAHKLHLAGIGKEEALKQTIGAVRKKKRGNSQ